MILIADIFVHVVSISQLNFLRGAPETYSGFSVYRRLLSAMWVSGPPAPQIDIESIVFMEQLHYMRLITVSHRWRTGGNSSVFFTAQSSCSRRWRPSPVSTLGYDWSRQLSCDRDFNQSSLAHTGHDVCWRSCYKICIFITSVEFFLKHSV